MLIGNRITSMKYFADRYWCNCMGARSKSDYWKHKGNTRRRCNSHTFIILDHAINHDIMTSINSHLSYTWSSFLIMKYDNLLPWRSNFIKYSKNIIILDKIEAFAAGGFHSADKSLAPVRSSSSDYQSRSPLIGVIQPLKHQLHVLSFPESSSKDSLHRL